MIDHLETLIEIQKLGTMAKASASLRVGQSAVSKRIAALEHTTGLKLLEKVGRNVALTPAGIALLDRVSPLLAQLRESLTETRVESRKKVRLGVSESILSSWGAKNLNRVFDKLDIEVEYHCHRSPLVAQRVESGIYDLGFCCGKIANSNTLLTQSVGEEELVLVSNSSRQLKQTSTPLDILTIEQSSATWKSIRYDVLKNKLNPVWEIESFFSIGQLANAGHGIGLVPLGVAKSLGIKKSCITHLKWPIYRPIQLIYKKSKLDQPHFVELIKQLQKVKCE